MTEPTPTPTPTTTDVVTTKTEPAKISPLTRWYRTLIQVAGALVVAIPASAAAFGISAEKAAKYSAFMGGLVAAASALHNALNAKAGS